jgi:hypothetical protein
MTIYIEGKDGVCPECGLNVQAIHERARHEKALKTVMTPEKKEEKKKSGDPFSPDFGI